MLDSKYMWVRWLSEAPVTVLLSVATLILFFCPVATSHFEWRNDWSGSDSLLSLLGCHLLHWNAEHLFWDLCMFSITGFLCERISRTAFCGVLLISAVAIPLCVMCLHPTLGSYRGLSGLDTALFALLISRTWITSSRDHDRLRSLGSLGLWLAMLGKSLFEFATGGVMFVNSDNFIPIPVAHLVGIVCGTLIALTIGFSGWRVGLDGGVVRCRALAPVNGQ